MYLFNILIVLISKLLVAQERINKISVIIYNIYMKLKSVKGKKRKTPYSKSRGRSWLGKAA